MRNLKDKKIVLCRKTTVKDSAGFAGEIYKAIHPGKLWAYVRQLSAGEFYASQALQQKEEMFFTINWRDDIDPPTAFFVCYKEKFYSITRVDTFEGYKEDLKLYALFLASQSKPGEIIEWQG
ncbi:MAG: phage head closure protein [Defluviitaleaceae bacterium]|nr:phage head closure protein [Defluviitaleaceae bacterium]MCL2239169.1 phage head closure protein [Defluviitaleaceae bacterium]